MQNYQQNSYNINAGYNANLLAFECDLPTVFRINALSITKDISAIADKTLRHN